MGFLKNLIYGDPESQGMTYRIRVFDHGHHIKTATTPARGQRRINLVVKPKDYYFLGEEVKLSFLINPKITPKYFGNVMEVDFDVRDSTQLADIFDLCPDLVYEINQKFYEKMKALQESDNVLEAEFTEKTETKGEEKSPVDPLEALTDPIPTDPPAEPEKGPTDLEKAIEKIPGVVATTKAIDAIAEKVHNVKTDIHGFNMLRRIESEEKNSKKQELTKKALEFCALPGNQKCLRWLPAYLHLEPEVSAIVSQIELDGVGIMPEYYTKQSTAEISEKMLARPKVAEDWKIILVYAAIALGVLMICAGFMLKLLGKI
jgi:hypothetical protein